MVVVPPATPVTIPEVPTVAADVLLLLHAPPTVASLNAVVPPAHTASVPVMLPIEPPAFTVTTVVAFTV